MKPIVRLALVLLVLVVLAGGGYLLTAHGEQPPAPVMVHHDLTPQVVAPAGPSQNAGASLPELPPVGGH
ncbi:hypothetical protein [Bombella mellum]|uniref:Uncharacterized protein n=1 Tax=Bombella mellum TaxID=2039288 RepID=A0ABR5ZQR7_9PROT|nr:hypothetical protein [Bombella mellum]MBA5726680.1 hypothetical protein [Bombella mellum]